MNTKMAGVDKMIGAHPESYWKTPLFKRKDGRFVYPIGGGAPADDDDDDDGGGDADDDAADDDLDAEIDDAVGDDDDTDDDDTSLTDAEKKLAKRLEKTMATQLAAATQSIADRLVNAQNTAAKKADRARAAARAAAGGGAGKGKAEETKVVDHTPDIRDARATYRELVQGEIAFASNVEREAGMLLAGAVITREITGGSSDPDEAGKKAAKSVAETITAIRKDARKNLLVQLRKEGRLVVKEKEAGGGTGGGIGAQPNRGGGTGKSVKTDYQAGADAAARIRPRASTTKTT